MRQSDDFGEPLHGANQESILAVVRPALADCTAQTIRYRSTVPPENADDTPGAGSIGRWRENVAGDPIDAGGAMPNGDKFTGNTGSDRSE